MSIKGFFQFSGETGNACGFLVCRKDSPKVRHYICNSLWYCTRVLMPFVGHVDNFTADMVPWPLVA